MTDKQTYDVAIIGGGLAGLAAAIEISRRGRSVILYEKEKYPFHKVCGEYVSRESWRYLNHLGLDLKKMELPEINNFCLTSPSGKIFRTKLPLGGFGISRYLMDASLASIAKKAGAVVCEETKVDNVSFDGKVFRINTSGLQQKNEITASVCLAAFGKRSKLDVKWKRKFLEKQDRKLNNYLAVKYHIITEMEAETIALHNFPDGYCGISKVEGGVYCLCYQVNASALQKAGNNIGRLESEVLALNPHLKKILAAAEVCEGFPLTISQINFQEKSSIEDHILMLGDAAGMITPLCGNGMSIALHTGKTGAALAVDYLAGKISRKEMETAYSREWNKNFSRRLKAGRFLQKFFGSGRLSNSLVSLMKIFPFLAKPVIRLTHGKPF